MIIKVLRESGAEEALLGMSLSYYDHLEPLETWWNDEKKQRAHKRATSLAHRGGGHSKFLESVQVWIFLQASRDVWSEFDTYRVGISKQSSSTMHTLDKRYVTEADFEEGTASWQIAGFNECLRAYKDAESSSYKDITRLKKNLPEGWLQERVISTNYKCLQNILAQRQKHRLKQWREFCDGLLEQLQHPEWANVGNTSLRNDHQTDA
jgi:thymidylate synthase ThyX